MEVRALHDMCVSHNNNSTMDHFLCNTVYHGYSALFLSINVLIRMTYILTSAVVNFGSKKGNSFGVETVETNNNKMSLEYEMEIVGGENDCKCGPSCKCNGCTCGH
eukprot:Gb_28130 [translate_table: standard]